MQRLDPFNTTPRLMRPLLALEECVANCALEPHLIDLVRIRASQLNRCVYSLHLHCEGALLMGEQEERLYLLNAWQDSQMYSAREKAALAWTETLTLLPEKGAPEELFQQLQREFNESEQVALTLLIGTVNLWNRLAQACSLVHPHDVALKAAANEPQWRTPSTVT